MATLAPSRPVRWEGSVGATLAELRELRNLLADALSACGWGREDAFRVLVCADEAFANALTHGNAWEGSIGAGFRVAPARASVRVSDGARGSDAGFTGAVRVPGEASEHGRGLILMRALSDRMHVHRRSGGTAVVLGFERAARRRAMEGDR